ncbi:MAG: GNAT family N-acetyltransferase [Firmicutes bacterium]|nr:GNAT family N-acetyltransferase [Bacillota bacterium]MBR2620325.1 GNAT family N-acetyltransferase [Bacillota bacterium]MBR6798977.1 GNAT family N-acetyltransferase [Bacillota bacterium]
METQNFIIRETEFRDYEYFAVWEKDPVVTKYLSFDEERTYEDVVTEGLYNKFNKERIDLTIVARQSGEPVGRIYISRIDRHSDSLDITKFYIGDPKLWGKGIGREIMNEVLEYCFTFLHMERVTLDYYTGNKRASTLYESLGFKSEGVARNATKKDGKYYDLHLMSMLRSEFFGDKN